MIQLSPHMRILVCIEPVDFRAGIDGLCRVSRQVLETDPLGGAVLVFRNRRGTYRSLPPAPAVISRLVAVGLTTVTRAP